MTGGTDVRSMTVVGTIPPAPPSSTIESPRKSVVDLVRVDVRLAPALLGCRGNNRPAELPRDRADHLAVGYRGSRSSCASICTSFGTSRVAMRMKQ